MTSAAQDLETAHSRLYYLNLTSSPQFSYFPKHQEPILLFQSNHRAWKLGATGCEGIFLGYENKNTAYDVLHLPDSKILTLKQVAFDKSIFPCPKDNETTNPCSIIIEAPNPEIKTETHPTKDPITETDKSQPLLQNCDAPSQPEDDPLEEEETSSNSSPELPPANPSRIRVIGPHPPTLVTSDINNINILPYSRKVNTFVTSLGSTLHTIKAALYSLERDKWIKAIKKKLLPMTELNVWEMIELKRDYKLVGPTWVFKIKKNHISETNEYKARLCAQGFTQTPEINSDRTYSPTGRLNSLCTLIVFAASEGLQFHQVDVKSAFLNAPLTKDVYLYIPQGLEVDFRRYCPNLKKAIRGLKQAPLAWYEYLKDWLVKIGFVSCLSDPCVFHRDSKSPTWIYIHVDDITIFGHDVTVFKREISYKFNIGDSDPADLMLGIKINHFNDAISLDQQRFTESLIHLYGMTDCKPVATPLMPNTYLQPATPDDIAKFNSLNINFRSAVGSNNYLSTATHPNLFFSDSSLSQFMKTPGVTHWQSLLEVETKEYSYVHY
ncbi:hypothetical protein O181_018931 [Austropuccinia psidii MF-1]|uniref:Reverse transcriptase Ty1/copia-type domain-containing protein n=1 Tax=Austropuccinia psidii MF-1 TaxID=1389203 RepID=A0A9Q3GTD7_9BASI|nr:hypothetical protein [Austropuccinia psidii MF-1]